MVCCTRPPKIHSGLPCASAAVTAPITCPASQLLDLLHQPSSTLALDLPHMQCGHQVHECLITEHFGCGLTSVTSAYTSTVAISESLNCQFSYCGLQPVTSSDKWDKWATATWYSSAEHIGHLCAWTPFCSTMVSLLSGWECFWRVFPRRSTTYRYISYYKFTM